MSSLPDFHKWDYMPHVIYGVTWGMVHKWEGSVKRFITLLVERVASWFAARGCPPCSEHGGCDSIDLIRTHADQLVDSVWAAFEQAWDTGDAESRNRLMTIVRYLRKEAFPFGCVPTCVCYRDGSGQSEPACQAQPDGPNPSDSRGQG